MIYSRDIGRSAGPQTSSISIHWCWHGGRGRCDFEEYLHVITKYFWKLIKYAYPDHLKTISFPEKDGHVIVANRPYSGIVCRVNSSLSCRVCVPVLEREHQLGSALPSVIWRRPSPVCVGRTLMVSSTTRPRPGPPDTRRPPPTPPSPPPPPPPPPAQPQLLLIIGNVSRL